MNRTQQRLKGWLQWWPTSLWNNNVLTWLVSQEWNSWKKLRLFSQNIFTAYWITDWWHRRKVHNKSNNNLVSLWNWNINANRIIEKSEKFHTFCCNERKEANVLFEYSCVVSSIQEASFPYAVSNSTAQEPRKRYKLAR